MSKSPARRAGSPEEARRKHRSRPMPKWLKDSQRLDEIARSRTMMVLSVLSGEKPVTDAIRQAKISRGTYYQMETRALNAMLTALNPIAAIAPTGTPDLSAARIEALLERVQRLERDKRRTQRLLLLTRKSLRAPLTTGRRGRLPRSALLASMASGATPLRASKARASTMRASTSTRAGESARSSKSAS